MKISYKKDGNQNFMIIKEQIIDENDYKFQMVINNNIKGLVPLSVKSINNRQEIYYDTTSMVSVESMYAKKRMSGQEVYNLIKSIKKLSDTMKEYLLDINNVLFDTAYVYIKKNEEQYAFCYCSQSGNDFQGNLRSFFDKLLEYINHNDRKAVLIAYGIQQVTIGDSFTVQDLLDCAEKNIRKFEKEYEKTDNNKTMETVERKSGRIEVKYEKLQQENSEVRKNVFQKIVDILKGKNKYKDEDQLWEENKQKDIAEKSDYTEDIGTEYGEEMFEEEATMLLTSSGAVKPITLKNLDEELSMEVTPDKFPYVLGKSKKSSDFYLDSPVVSRVHLRISEDMAGYFVEDLNSTNGTFVNGIQLAPHEMKEINEGDRITIADMEFIVEQNF